MSAAIESPRRAYSKRQAAATLGLSERTLDRLRAAGKIKGVQVSVRRIVFTADEINRFLEAGFQEA